MLKFPAYFTGFRSKSDGSAGLTFATQELTSEDFAQLKTHHSAFGWLLFSEGNLGITDIPSEVVEEDGISPSERLRRVMFVYWKQKIHEGDFDLWRKQRIEKLIDQYKEKLDPQ